jgi:hypothetical protein
MSNQATLKCERYTVLSMQPLERSVKSVDRGYYGRSVFTSFGGLLMHLRGDESNLNKLDIDTRIYLLMRKS